MFLLNEPLILYFRAQILNLFFGAYMTVALLTLLQIRPSEVHFPLL